MEAQGSHVAQGQAVPCRVLFHQGAAAHEVPAEAVRLDRQGGVLRLVRNRGFEALVEAAEVVVAFDLPMDAGPGLRRLLFLASVRHVSRQKAHHGWISVSFRNAAISPVEPG